MERPDGSVLAHVHETGYQELTISGEFWVSGLHVSITPSVLRVGTNTIQGSIISGFDRAIVINHDGLSLGVSGRPPDMSSRNERCHCGSGLRFKACHGRIA